ncbi:hypothetical protein ACFU76_32230 [Streptomyces sp. NPDC057539]|uniref:hypothetical protein n=1 Tax=Streptomyces sp. NPDC057539 TaxID=3346159 RepID=UPI0036A012F5
MKTFMIVPFVAGEPVAGELAAGELAAGELVNFLGGELGTTDSARDRDRRSNT